MSRLIRHNDINGKIQQLFKGFRPVAGIGHDQFPFFMNIFNKALVDMGMFQTIPAEYRGINVQAVLVNE
jgi:hypothetical protein